MLKAIETSYGGYSYRSRLEARWGVFLDRLGVRFDYESEGFDLTDVPQNFMPLVGAENRYLPDFWLPIQRSWMEVKPIMPTSVERERAVRLAVASKSDVVIVSGTPWAIAEKWWARMTDGYPDPEFSGHTGTLFTEKDTEGTSMYLLTACPFCGRVDWCYCGEAGDLPCDCPNPKNSVGDFARVQVAYLAARRARFEFGQAPQGRGGL